MGAHIFSKLVFVLQINTWCSKAGPYNISINFLRHFNTVFHSAAQITFHQEAMRTPFSPHSSQSLLLVVFFDNSCSDRCEVVSSLGFDLHFPDD